MFPNMVDGIPHRSRVAGGGDRHHRISTLLAIIGGLPLGFLIFVTDRHLFWQNRTLNIISSVLVNIVRSVPFVILLVRHRRVTDQADQGYG